MTEYFDATKMNEQNERLEKLFQAARNARETSDDATALKHYEEISTMSPDSWEAMFYLVVLKTNKITNGEIASAAISVQNCLPKVFELIKSTISDIEEQKKAVKEVIDQCYETAMWLTTASENFYKSVTQGNGTMAMTGIFGAATSLDATAKARNESSDRSGKIGNIMCLCGNLIEQFFDMNDKFYSDIAVACWKRLIDVHFNHIKFCKAAVYSQESLVKFADKIKKYDPSYELSELKATANRNNIILGVALVGVALAIGIIYALWIGNIF